MMHSADVLVQLVCLMYRCAVMLLHKKKKKAFCFNYLKGNQLYSNGILLNYKAEIPTCI